MPAGSRNDAAAFAYRQHALRLCSEPMTYRFESVANPFAELSATVAAAWNALLARSQPAGSQHPFMRFEYLSAMTLAGCATASTGWKPYLMLLWDGAECAAACALYVKSHSWGEYVFDFAWADAYLRHGLPYYPKAVVAVPFTPVAGPRLLARSVCERQMLLRHVRDWCAESGLSSLHVLFGSDDDLTAAVAVGMHRRLTVQFHWSNSNPPYENWEAFMAALSQSKRKNVRQERRKVAEAGVTFRIQRGSAITPMDWDFFYACYEQTYREHGNAAYLTREFFHQLAADGAEAWVLFVAERNAQPIAASLIALEHGAEGCVAYGRYWGALERVDCLHFEACYYQPLAWCIAHQVVRFEGGAQGEHKLARALLPARTHSAHLMLDPRFDAAVARFLEQEVKHIDARREWLDTRTPFRAPDAQVTPPETP